MSNLGGFDEWLSDKPSVSYHCYDLISYERVYVSIPVKQDFQIIPISPDITYFGILYDKYKVILNKNEENIDSSFSIPFAECKSADELNDMIFAFVSKFGKQVEEQIKVYVYRHIDSEGRRFVAIGGTNLFAKDPIIHDLRIKTLQTKLPLPQPLHVWSVISEEMGTLSETPKCCSIEKQEVLEINERTVPVASNFKDVLILGSPENRFQAMHYQGKTQTQYHDPVSKRNGNVYTLPSFRVKSELEFNKKILWAINAFREITGIPSSSAIGMYSNLPNEEIEVSVIVTAGKGFSLPVKDDKDEEDSPF